MYSLRVLRECGAKCVSNGALLATTPHHQTDTNPHETGLRATRNTPAKGLQIRVSGVKSRRHLDTLLGPLAQWLARFLDTEEATGAIPVWSTKSPLSHGKIILETLSSGGGRDPSKCTASTFPVSPVTPIVG